MDIDCLRRAIELWTLLMGTPTLEKKGAVSAAAVNADNPHISLPDSMQGLLRLGLPRQCIPQLQWPSESTGHNSGVPSPNSPNSPNSNYIYCE